MSNKLYKCSKCGKKKQGFEFSVRKGKPASWCKLCHNKVSKANYEKRKDERATYREENKDRIAAYKKKYRKENQAIIAAYREENKDRIATYQKEYRKENRDSRAAYQKEYIKENRDSHNARNGLRRASKLQRTPKWLTATDISKIKSIYKIARALSKKTGTPHHVDHVIPLQGELVSGLHCPANLQVIPASENWSKSNKYSV